MEDVIIIGGGIAGLTAAYMLAKNDHRVVVLEKDPALGGLSSAYKIDKFLIERFYHHLFPTDTSLRGIISEVGLSDELVWKPASMATYYKNCVYPFNTPLDLLKFKPLPFLDRIRFGRIILELNRRQFSEELDQETAKEWLIRKGGLKLFSSIFDPLLYAKFGAAADKASAAWLSARIKTRASSKGNMMRNEKLGYLRGSLDALFQAIKKEIERRQDAVICAAEVKEILVKNSRATSVVYMTRDGQKSIDAKCVLSTSSIPTFLKITPNLPFEYVEQLKRINYVGAVCVLMGLKESLSDIYWLNVASRNMPIGIFIEHTNFYSGPEYEGQTIVYSCSYAESKNSLFCSSTEELLQVHVKTIQKIFPQFRPDIILWKRVTVDSFSSPLYAPGYNQYMPTIPTPINGLFISGMGLTFPDRNLNSSVKVGAEAANQIHNYLLTNQSVI